MVYILFENFKQEMKLIRTAVILLLIFTFKSGFAQRISVEKYIRDNKEAAIYYMNEYGVPASVILGVAIHESAAGNSKIARYLNNHFGIKGSNKSKEIRSSYKGYPSVRASYGDFVGLLRRRPRYSALFQLDPADYEAWIKGIAGAGYAMSRTWPQQVLRIIREHKLNRWDKSVSEADVSVAEVYRVKSGDTLFEIARRFHTTVQELIRKNNLGSNVLQIGQHLKL